MNTRPVRIGVFAALLTAVAGFGMLCGFWFFGTYDPSVPGLFDYRSATVGDGLLLPVLVGVLTAAAASLRSHEDPPPHRRPLAMLAGLGGGLAGALVIWRWHEDPDPRLNWTWPAPHDFNCAGWTHAVFLCLAAAVVAALLVYVLVSLRARRSRDSELPFSSVALAVWAAVGMVGLILRDNQQASGTEAALATTLAVAAAALLAMGLAFWAGGRRMLPPVAVGALAGAGTLAYCFQWPPDQVGLTASLWVPAVALALALTQPLAQISFKGREMLLLACAIATAGALAVGTQQVIDERLWATLLIGFGAVALLVALPIFFASPDLRHELIEDLPGTAGVVSFIIAALLTAAWLAFTDFSKQHALATLSAIELTFDILVFTLFRNRFRELVEVEAATAACQRPPRDCEAVEYRQAHGHWRKPKKKPEDTGKRVRYGAVPDLYLTLYVYGVAVLAAMIVLLAAAAGPIGLNDVVIGSDPSGSVFMWLGATLLVTLAVGGLTIRLAAGRASRDEVDEAPRLGAGALLSGLVATAALASIALLGGEFNHPGLAAAAALVYSLLVVESLVFSPIRLQLEEVGAGRALLIVATGLAVFAASFWLFSVGVWSHGGPASVWRIGVVSILVIGSCFVLAATIGASLARCGSGMVMTPSDPGGNTALDQFLYALFMFLIGVFPVTAAAQIDAATGESFALVSSLMFLPGLFGAFIWVVDNNSTHHRKEQELPSPRETMWVKAGWDLKRAETLLGDYKSAMHLHGRLQNRGATTALIASFIFVAAKLMGL